MDSLALPSRRLLEAEAVRRDFSLFLKGAFRAMHGDQPLHWNWHLDMICDDLQALKEGREDRRVICVSPGGMKSFSSSVSFPAWWLLPGNDPSMSFLSVSNGQELATRDNVRCRDLILSPWYQQLKADLEVLYPNDAWEFKGDENRKQKFQTTAGGFRQGIGIGTNVLGVRVRCIIFDDVIDTKDIGGDAVQTGKRMATIRQQLASGVESRRTPGVHTVMLSIQQRVHVDDPAGWHIERGWPATVIPAEYDPTHADPRDPRTEPGELFQPDLFSREFIEEKRRINLPHVFEAMYNQKPFVPTGGQFRAEDWVLLPRAQFPERYDQTIVGVDLAFEGTAKSDYCVAYVVGRVGGMFYVLHRERIRADYPEQKELLRSLNTAWKPDGFAVEKAANGAAIVSELRLEIPGVEPVSPHGSSKVARAQAWTPIQRARQIVLPEDAPWTQSAIAQFTQFPHGSHDDDVDALGWAITVLRRGDAPAMSAEAFTVYSDAAGYF